MERTAAGVFAFAAYGGSDPSATIGYATYDFAAHSWKTGNEPSLNTPALITRDGIAAWIGDTREGAVIYDPVADNWDERFVTKSGASQSVNITNSTVTVVNGGVSTVLGFANGNWHTNQQTAVLSNFDAQADATLTQVFWDMSIGGASWSWDFGDGTLSSARSAIHTYATPGIYTVQQTVTGPSGTNQSSQTIVVGTVSLGTPDLDAASDTGSNNSDNITSDNTPTFTGTLPAGSSKRVSLRSDGVEVAQGTFSGSTWSLTASTIPYGVHSFTAHVLDSDGTILVSSPALGVTMSQYSAVSWDGGGDGVNWTDALNWSGNVLPGPADDVTISVAANPTINLSSGTQSIHSLVCDELLTISGTLQLATTATISQNATLFDGTIQGGTIMASGGAQLVALSGVLSGVTLASDMSIANGKYVSISNGLTLSGGATIMLTSTANTTYLFVLPGAQTIGGNGQIVLSGNDSRIFSLSPGTATLTLGSGITVRGRGSIAQNPGTTLEVINQGTIEADASANTLHITANITNSGTFKANNGATLNLASTITNGLGNLDSSGGAIRLTGTLQNTATTLALVGVGNTITLGGGTIVGGTVTASGGASLVVDSGTLSGVTLASDVSIANGKYLSISNGLTLSGGAKITLASTANTTFLFILPGAQTIGGNGQIVLSGNDSRIFSLSPGTATLTLGSGITVRGQGSIAQNPGTSLVVINQGTIQADVSGQTLTVNVPNWTSSGLLKASNGGILDIAGTLDNTGKTLTLESTGAFIRISGTIQGGTLSGVINLFASTGGILDGVILDAGLTIPNAADVRVKSGLVINAGRTITLGGTNGSGASLIFDGPQSLSGGGQIFLGGSSANNYVNVYGSGTQAGAATLTIGSGITIHGSQGGTVAAVNTYDKIINQGTINADTAGKTIAVGGDFTNSGTLEAMNGAILNVFNTPTNFSAGTLTGGTWAVYADSTLQIAGATITTNAATIILDGGNANIYKAISGAIDALATLSTITSAGSLTLAGGKDLSVAPTGTFTNSGMLNLGAGSTLSVISAYTQTSGGTLRTDIAGGQQTAVGTNGAVSLDGTLTATLVGGYDPGLGVNLPVVIGASRSGTFSSITLPTTPAGRALLARYNTTSAIIGVGPLAPSTPDLDPDSDTGASNSDNNTGDTTPKFNGTSTDNGTVQLFSDGVLVGTTSVSAGAWSVTTSTLSEGQHSITAKVVDGDGDESPVSGALIITIDTTPMLGFSVTGNGIVIVDGDQTPGASDGTDFGTILQAGTGPQRTFIVTNTRTDDLLLGSVTLPAGYVLVEPLVSVLHQGQFDSFTIALSTAVAGTFAGDVSFGTNQPGQNPFNFAITGTVTPLPAPEVKVEYNGIEIVDGDTTPSLTDGTDFGGSIQGQPGTIRIFTVRNTGQVSLTTSGLTVPGGFTIIEGLSATIPAGGSDTFTVQLQTTALGAPGGDITFITNDGDENPTNFKVQGLIYASGGSVAPLAPDQYVSTYNPKWNGWSHAQAVDANGNYVIIWQVYDNGGSASTGLDVYGRRFSAAGVAQGEVFRVNTLLPRDQFLADVAMRPTGEFIVTWQSAKVAGNGYDIYARRYSTSGTPLDAEEILVKSDAGGSFQESYATPQIAIDNSGNFVISWDDEQESATDWDIFAKRYDASGNAIGTEFRVNTYLPAIQQDSSIAMNGGGAFVITWGSGGSDQDGSFSGTYARRFDSAGNPQGPEFLVNTTTLGHQNNPAVAIDAAGNFVVVWSNDPGNDGLSFADVHMQRFNAAGAMLGVETRVNSTIASGQWLPQIGMQADGSFVVTWTSYLQDGDQRGIYARRYEATGTPQGSEINVTASGEGNQLFSYVRVAANGNFLVSWQVDNFGGVGNGVYVRRFGIPPRVVTSGTPNEVSASKLTFSFNSNVAASLSITDIVLERIGGGSVPGITLLPYGTDGANVATFMLNGPIPDGSYRVTLTASGITDPTTGLPMDSNYVLDFFTLAGDANHDRTVDIYDLAILASNWHGTGKVFSEGDFNYDGKVDAIDLGILAANWQKNLSAAPPPAAPASTATATRGRTPTRVVTLIQR